MKRKRPYSNTQRPHGTQHSPHPGGQFVPRNMPGPSSSPGFIPISNGHHMPNSHSANIRSKMKTPHRSNQAFSPYHKNRPNHSQTGKRPAHTSVAVNKSPMPHKSVSLKGNSSVQVTVAAQNHVNKNKDGIEKNGNIEKKSSVDKTISVTQNEDIIVIAEHSSQEQSDSKRRKVITIDSDDDDKKDSSQSSSSGDHEELPPNIDIKTHIPQKYSLHLTGALHRYHSIHKQDKAFFDRKLFLRDGIQQIVSKNFGEGVLHLTGSSMSGFGTLKSDADMALVFDPTLNTISKKKSRNVITRLASCLRRQAFCRNVETIFAKVPIIKFFDNISRCDVDININNTVGIKNSFLLRSISLVDERIPPLVIAVKAWAKSHDINSAFMGSLSSYLIVTMIIYFLQTGVSPPILPPLKQYVDSLQSVNVNTQLEQFVPRTFIKYDVRNKEQLGDIFVKFFQFWVRKFRQNKVFSINTAQEKIRTYNTPFLDTSAYVLVLEEPFQKDNVARAVRPQQLDDVKQKFQLACDQFKDIASFEELFGSST